ncbi:MAG: hypothetical protein IVW52_04960 [Acidimicrobiales bacterium]|nr:hypothetical protein [Acidimicrobiales bacterium]
MATVTRAKFVLMKMSKTMQNVHNPETGKWDKYVPVWDLEFSAVTGGSDDPEDKAFWASSPSGQITLRTVNLEVVKAMDAELSHTFYVEFIPVPPPKPRYDGPVQAA